MARTLLRPWPLLTVALAFVGGSQAIAQAPVSAVESDKAKSSPPAESAPIEETKAALANPYAGPWSTWPKMTGDWFGHRKSLADHGITLDASITQFYQGVTSGGREQDWRYGGKLDYFLNVDGEKVGLWKGLFITMHAETRYGRDVNNIDGALLPSNINMVFPKPQDITSITSLKFVQALSENFLVFGGKLNLLDDYQPMIGGGGRGLDRFMNTSLAFAAIPLRQFPYSTLGAGFVVMKEQQQILSFMVYDPNDYATTIGIDDIFQSGVGLTAEARLPVKPFGLPGYHAVGGAWSSKQYTAVDPASFAIVPGQGIVAGTKSGSWSLYYGYNQFLWVDPCNPKRGWGFFGNAGIADGNPSPLRWSANAGFAGNNPMQRRANDTFGVGYFYNGLSQDFKALLNGPVLGQRDEHGGELFYNIAITPWCHLTADLQVVQPSTQRFNTAVLPGVRLKIDF